jgi:hypothetical protein
MATRAVAATLVHAQPAAEMAFFITSAGKGVGANLVGHHDRVGLKATRHMTSWNSSHGSAGCSLEAMKMAGGKGFFCCFVAN